MFALILRKQKLYILMLAFIGGMGVARHVAFAVVPIAQCDLSILNRPEMEWVIGGLEDLNHRMLCTHGSYEWPIDPNISNPLEQPRAKALRMRAKIIEAMISPVRSDSAEAVKFLAHYMNIDHRGDLENYRRGDPSLGFIPRGKAADVLNFIDQQAPKLSRQELARVIGFESAAGSTSEVPYKFQPKLMERLNAEKNPAFMGELLQAMEDRFIPVKPNPAYDAIQARVAGMSPEVLFALIQKDYLVFQESQNGVNTEQAESTRLKILAELSRHAGANGRIADLIREEIPGYLPDNAGEATRPDTLSMIERYMDGAPLAHSAAFLQNASMGVGKFPDSKASVLRAISKRNAGDLAVLMGMPADQDYKDFAIGVEYRRSKDKDWPSIGKVLQAYYGNLKEEKREDAGVLQALDDYASHSSPSDLVRVLSNIKNAPALSRIRGKVQEMSPADRYAIYKEIAKYKELPAADAFNKSLAQIQSDALTFAQFNPEVKSEKERHDLLFQIVDSTMLASSPDLRKLRGRALLSLVDRMKKNPLASDKDYKAVLEYLVNENFDQADLDAQQVHFASIQAYRQIMGDDAKNYLFETLVKSEQGSGALNSGRKLNLYLGLRNFANLTADDKKLLAKTQSQVSAYMRRLNFSDHPTAISVALRLMEARASEYDSDVGMAFFNSLQFNFLNANKDSIKQKMALIRKVCMEDPGIAMNFKSVQYLCGFRNDLNFPRMQYDFVDTQLAALVNSTSDEELRKLAEDLYAQLYTRAQEVNFAATPVPGADSAAQIQGQIPPKSAAGDIAGAASGRSTAVVPQAIVPSM